MTNEAPLGISLPLRIRRHAESVAVEDAVGRTVSYVYFAEDPQRQSVARRVGREEAIRIAQITARALTEAASS